MNTLLTNSDIPGSFGGDQHAQLMAACKEAAQRDEHMLDSSDELYRWFTQQAFNQVGMELTSALTHNASRNAPPLNFPVIHRQLPLAPNHQTAILKALVAAHMSMYTSNHRLAHRQANPCHYLNLIDSYVKLFNEKMGNLEEQQRHHNIGLDKLDKTVVRVEEMRRSLVTKRTQLAAKETKAE
ncbi:hypothetical protein PSTT_02341 [Puccinia striiformis]|nr:hypothetical protein PSTT_02341 [Puccinia striiformis]